jgi:signal transduction histidine kinase
MSAYALETLEGGRPYRFESAITHADGTRIPVEIRGRAATQEGHALRLVAVRDISEQKRAEAELIAARKLVEKSVESRNRILNNVSHEFRTPLAIMLGYAEMLKGGKFDDACELGELIYDSGRKLNDTLNLILELAQIEGRGFALDREMLDVAELVDEVVRTHIPRAQSKGLRLDAGADFGRHFANTDRIRLLKILDYLLDNAIKFTREGGIDLSVDSDEEQVRIVVSDTGIGIDEEYLPHIFQSFSQQSTGLTRSHGGLGVGLSIAAHMADMMKGRIEISTVLGQGSTFTVVLPRGVHATAHMKSVAETRLSLQSSEEALWF